MKHTHRRNNTPAIFWVPTRQGALDALWDVIEHNGLVRAIELGVPSTSEESAVDPSADWKHMFPTIADLARRRWRSR
jgi:hypothetical protein